MTPNDIAAEMVRGHKPECRCAVCCKMRKSAKQFVEEMTDPKADPFTIAHYGSNTHSGGRVTRGEQ